MNNDAENEADQKKEEETDPEEGYPGEDEAMEDSLASSGMEEGSTCEDFLPSGPLSNKSGTSHYATKSDEGKAQPIDPREERMMIVAREKWLSVTGRKPLSIPTVRKYQKDETEAKRIAFFGNRRPDQIEIERKQKWVQMITDEVYKKSGVNYGIVLKENGIPYTTGGLWSLRIHPHGGYLATGFRNGEVQVRNLHTSEILIGIKTIETNDKLPVRTIRYYPPDPTKLYLAGAAGVVQVYDLEAQALADIGSSISQVNNMDFNMDASILATGGRDGIVNVIDPGTLKVISRRERPEMNESTTSKINDGYHRLRVYGVRCHPNEINIFLTGGWDRSVKIWDVRVPTAVRSIEGPFINGDGLDINGKTVLTASWTCENSVQLWDFLSGSLMNTIPIQTKSTRFDGEFLYTAQFVNDGTEYPSNSRLVVVGGSGFNEICVIRIPTGKILASFPAYKAVTCIHTYKSYVVYGGKESLLRLGQMRLPKTY